MNTPQHTITRPYIKMWADRDAIKANVAGMGSVTLVRDNPRQRRWVGNIVAPPEAKVWSDLWDMLDSLELSLGRYL